MLHIPRTNYHLLVAKQESYQKASQRKILKNFLEEKVRRMGQEGEKRERAMGIGRRTKRGDRRVESNKSLEISDRAKTSNIPGPPFRVGGNKLRVILGYRVQLDLRLFPPPLNVRWVEVNGLHRPQYVP